jgi:hypothetical protein
MHELKWNFMQAGRTRQQCCSLMLLWAWVGPAMTAEPPPTAVTPLRPTETARPAEAAPAVLRTDADARADFDARPFASADVWVPQHAPRSFPMTFTPVPDLHSRAYLQDLSIPTMGGDGHGIRDQSPTEQLIRQVKREGMPLARLWQNDQALVSLGLNRKGKPGLWIIQKTR